MTETPWPVHAARMIAERIPEEGWRVSKRDAEGRVTELVSCPLDEADYDRLMIPTGEHTLACGCHLRGRTMLNPCAEHEPVLREAPGHYSVARRALTEHVYEPDTIFMSPREWDDYLTGYDPPAPTPPKPDADTIAAAAHRHGFPTVTIRTEDTIRADNAAVFVREETMFRTMLRRNRHRSVPPHDWYGPDPEPNPPGPDCACAGCMVHP